MAPQRERGAGNKNNPFSVHFFQVFLKLHFPQLGSAVFTGLKKQGLFLFPYSVLLRDNGYPNILLPSFII